MSWYHLSFLAVSIAMLGMAGGAVRAYTKKELSEPGTAPAVLARYSTLFAVSIPLSHAANLCIPIVWTWSLATIISVALTVAVLTIPFYLSGIVVAVALTRIPGPTGLVYACDLAGAAFGSLLVVQMLNSWSLSAVMLLCSGVAAAGALCFHLFAETGRSRWVAALMLVLVAAGSFNDRAVHGLRVVWAKGAFQVPALIVAERWTNHGLVTAQQPVEGDPQYWGKGKNAPDVKVSTIRMTIDGLGGHRHDQVGPEGGVPGLDRSRHHRSGVSSAREHRCGGHRCRGRSRSPDGPVGPGAVDHRHRGQSCVPRPDSRAIFESSPASPTGRRSCSSTTRPART